MENGGGGGSINEIHFDVLEDHWEHFWSRQIFINMKRCLVAHSTVDHQQWTIKIQNVQISMALTVMVNSSGLSTSGSSIVKKKCKVIFKIPNVEKKSQFLKSYVTSDEIWTFAGIVDNFEIFLSIFLSIFNLWFKLLVIRIRWSTVDGPLLTVNSWQITIDNHLLMVKWWWNWTVKSW